MFFFKKRPLFLVYGANGWIGSMYTEYLKKNGINFIKGKERIDNTESVVIEISIHKPTHVVSLTGRTHGTIGNEKINTIDYLEYPGKMTENIKDNLYGPINLALICKRKGIHYTYLGTGCIFNSKGLNTETPESFDENSFPNYFGSGYSVVKGYTDRLMHNLDCLNLRIRMPISSKSNDRNFINKITGYSKICSIPNSMTVLDDFFPIFTDMILKKKIGTYNCTNPGTISHNEILEMYRETVNPNFKWENFTLEEQSKILKSDRSNNYLNTLKLEKEYNILPIKESIKNVLKNFKN